uniref:Uncharacterized protein n=1 Tax=Cucumis melo TaxID=3656 RepID=A0A9I9EH76_CUCME
MLLNENFEVFFFQTLQILFIFSISNDFDLVQEVGSLQIRMYVDNITLL